MKQEFETTQQGAVPVRFARGDSEDPFNWPLKKKLRMFMAAVVVTYVSAFNASANGSSSISIDPSHSQTYVNSSKIQVPLRQDSSRNTKESLVKTSKPLRSHTWSCSESVSEIPRIFLRFGMLIVLALPFLRTSYPCPSVRNFRSSSSAYHLRKSTISSFAFSSFQFFRNLRPRRSRMRAIELTILLFPNLGRIRLVLE